MVSVQAKTVTVKVKTITGHCSQVNRIGRNNSQSDIQGNFTINKIQGSFWRKLRKWKKRHHPGF